MKSYIKLVNFEVNRFAKLYVLLMIIIFVIQLATTIILGNIYTGKVAEMTRSGMGKAEFIDMYSTFGLINITHSLGFLGPVAIGVAALLFYMFFIWYRDWFSKTTFAYRLLTLPTARMNVFFAKLTTIMFAVWGLVALQLCILKILEIVIKWIVPLSFRDTMSLMETVNNSGYLNILYPQGIIEFLIAYGIGLAFVIIIFTMILLERSYRIIGFVSGLVYAGVCIVIGYIPIFGQYVFDFYLYPAELFFVELFVVLIIVLLSMWISRYLLNTKVSV